MIIPNKKRTINLLFSLYERYLIINYPYNEFATTPGEKLVFITGTIKDENDMKIDKDGNFNILNDKIYPIKGKVNVTCRYRIDKAVYKWKLYKFDEDVVEEKLAKPKYQKIIKALLNGDDNDDDFDGRFKYIECFDHYVKGVEHQWSGECKYRRYYKNKDSMFRHMQYVASIKIKFPLPIEIICNHVSFNLNVENGIICHDFVKNYLTNNDIFHSIFCNQYGLQASRIDQILFCSRHAQDILDISNVGDFIVEVEENYDKNCIVG